MNGCYNDDDEIPTGTVNARGVRHGGASCQSGVYGDANYGGEIHGDAKHLEDMQVKFAVRWRIQTFIHLLVSSSKYDTYKQYIDAHLWEI